MMPLQWLSYYIILSLSGNTAYHSYHNISILSLISYTHIPENLQNKFSQTNIRIDDQHFTMKNPLISQDPSFRNRKSWARRIFHLLTKARCNSPARYLSANCELRILNFQRPSPKFKDSKCIFFFFFFFFFFWSYHVASQEKINTEKFTVNCRRKKTRFIF